MLTARGICKHKDKFLLLKFCFKLSYDSDEMENSLLEKSGETNFNDIFKRKYLKDWFCFLNTFVHNLCL